jgi:hypothetical protein
VIIAEKYREAVHFDEMLAKAAAPRCKRIPFAFGVNDFTRLRKARQIGPPRTGSTEQLPKSPGFCVYSPAFFQFVYRPKLVDRMIAAVAMADKYQELLGKPTVPK